MTDLQKYKIENLRNEYNNNVNEYIGFGSERYCSFEVRKSLNEEDNSITIVSTLIEDLTEENIPFTKQIFYNILFDGELITMNLIMPPPLIAKYIINTKTI
jgi:hypothetical protein